MILFYYVYYTRGFKSYFDIYHINTIIIKQKVNMYFKSFHLTGRLFY